MFHRCILLLLVVGQSMANVDDILTRWNQSLYWGSYRPNLYFGMRTRDVDPLMLGLMWFGLGNVNDWQHIRHSCEMGDGMGGYGWNRHDGKSFGEQEIRDDKNHVTLWTRMIKQSSGEHGGDWSVRISGEPRRGKNGQISLLTYFGFDNEGGMQLRNQEFLKDATKPAILDGWKPQLGNFSIFLFPSPKNTSPKPYPDDEDDDSLPDPSIPHFLSTKMPQGHLWRIKDAVSPPLFYSARSIIEERGEDLPLPHPAQLFALRDKINPDSNLHLLQYQLEAPFEVDIVFLSASSRPDLDVPIPVSEAEKWTGEALTKKLEQATKDFDTRFDESFQIAQKGFKSNHVKFARAAVSQLIGGMGFFHGDSRVAKTDSQGKVLEYEETKEGEKKVAVVKMPPTSLFTATPSRSFFPRGFLWDEGFHQLIINEFDEFLSSQSIENWLNLMDKDGWIAREQILGDEARSKVPEEFQVQYRHYANPPTLLFPILSLVNKLEKVGTHHDQTILMATDASTATWFSTNQVAGKRYLQVVFHRLKENYAWFRKTQDGLLKGDRKGYAEGYRWRGRTENHTLTSGLDDYPRASPSDDELHLDLLCWMAFYSRTMHRLANLLEHWDDAEIYSKQYSEMRKTLYGLHFDASSGIFHDLTRDAETGKTIHVPHLGYVSMFPLCLQLLDAKDDALGKLLKHLNDANELWSDYGILSLSRTDAFYAQGENYWRGNIWINVNYLIVNALEHYATLEGPWKDQCHQLAERLKHALIENIYKNWRETGYFWEQFDANSGKGHRSHPFTGWTSLVALLMAGKRLDM